VPVIYYAFDLLYLDGLDLRRVALEQRKQLLQERIENSEVIHFSDHYAEKGLELFEAARQRGLEGIVAKKRSSATRKSARTIGSRSKSRSARSASSEATPIPKAAANISARWCWDCMTGRKRLIHVGQVGTGFDQKMLKEMFALCSRSRRNRIRFTARSADCGKFTSCVRNWSPKSSLPSGLTKRRKAA
jgi:bifunctional non-homologous end joining protein LigD